MSAAYLYEPLSTAVAGSGCATITVYTTAIPAGSHAGSER